MDQKETQLGVSVIPPKLKDKTFKNTKSNEFYKIGDLAKEFDTTLRALRFYEDRGLISPKRNGTTRLYSSRDRARLQLILLGRKVGFSLVEIKKMLDLYDLDDGQLTQIQYTRKKITEQVQLLELQKQEIEESLSILSEGAEKIDDWLADKV